MGCLTILNYFQDITVFSTSWNGKKGGIRMKIEDLIDWELMDWLEEKRAKANGVEGK